MPPTVTGKTPQNQLDALPLTDAATAAQGGDIVILGNSISRYWSPTVLAVNGIGFTTDPNGFFYLPTAFLDVRGCRSFAMLLRRINTTALPQLALPSMTVYMQYRFSNGEVPLISLGAIQNQRYIAAAQINSIPIVFPTMQVQSEVQTAFRGWNTGQEGGGAGEVQSQSLGTDVRFFILSATAPTAPNTFSMALWGSD